MLKLGRVGEPAREVEEEGELPKSKTKEEEVAKEVGEHLDGQENLPIFLHFFWRNPNRTAEWYCFFCLVEAAVLYLAPL